MDGMCPWRFDEKMRSVQLGDSGVTIGKAINKNAEIAAAAYQAGHAIIHISHHN